MGRAEAAEGAAEVQWRKVAREEHKRERQRRRRRADEDGEEGRIRSQIVQEVVAGSQEKVSMHDGVQNHAKSPVEQSFMRSLGLLTD